MTVVRLLSSMQGQVAGMSVALVVVLGCPVCNNNRPIQGYGSSMGEAARKGASCSSLIAGQAALHRQGQPAVPAPMTTVS